MVVVGFSGSLATFWKLFFLTFHQSLWPASSEDRSSTAPEHRKLLLSSEDDGHRDWQNVRKNNLQNMAKEPEKPTTTMFCFVFQSRGSFSTSRSAKVWPNVKVAKSNDVWGKGRIILEHFWKQFLDWVKCKPCISSASFFFSIWWQDCKSKLLNWWKQQYPNLKMRTCMEHNSV